MIKQKELTSATSCFSKAAADEPLFVLRAKDALAPQTVRLWATMAVGKHEQWKIDEALKLADEMEAWRAKNVLPVAAPTPDA